MNTNLNNIEANIVQLSPFELAEIVDGEVETSCFDNKPVLNCSQRWELWHRGYLSEYDFRREETRYVAHQVLKPHQHEKVEFQMSVENCPF